MTAFNAVRFRVKPGREQDFLDAHKKVERNWAGLQRVNIIKTADRTYCIIARGSLGAMMPSSGLSVSWVNDNSLARPMAPM